MKLIELSKGKYAKVDDCDFDALNKFNWSLMGHGYASRVEIVNGKRHNIHMHRVIMGTPEGMDTDHINMDRIDNQRHNLRICTRSENIMNQPKYKKGNSIFRGVHFNKKSGKWVATAHKQRKVFNLGYFKTPEEAARVYNKKVLELYGSFSKVNVL